MVTRVSADYLSDDPKGDDLEGDYLEGTYNFELETSVVSCYDVYVGAVSGAESVKLEEHVWVIDTGLENMSACPFDERLLDL